MKNIIMDMIRIIGNEAEFNLFLTIFSKIPRSKFALIKISGESLELHAEEIAKSIAFLHKLDLFPLIVHGAGTTLDKKLGKSHKKNGIRITTKSDIPIIQKTVTEIAEKLTYTIKKYGGKAEIVSGAIEADFLNKQEYGFVGQFANVDGKRLTSVLENGITPIVGPLTVSEDNQKIKLNINADTVARGIVSALGIKKLIFITETGGVLNEKNEIIPFINVGSSSHMPFVKGGMHYKVLEIKEFLESNRAVEISITSAPYLLKEIFTVKGNGTFFKYYNFKFADNYRFIDNEKIIYTLENSFGKKLKDHYFEHSQNQIVYHEDYEAVALVDILNELNYLCKFAVLNYRSGTGLGAALWEELMLKYPRLIWRAKPSNAANNFYMKRCDGIQKNYDWNIYWKGYAINEVTPIIEKIRKKEETFIQDYAK